ncbi:MAG: glycosyltransferase [Acidobacteriota bacterium]
MTTPPRVSVVIPLYRSARFLDNISANLEEMPPSVEVLLSDRHGDDDALDRLEDRHRGDRRLRFLRGADRLDWVEHLNLLLHEARGTYWRFLPHDDRTTGDALKALVDCLDAHPDTLLAYGPTRAIDLDGTALPELDTWQPHPIDNDDPWRLGLLLDCYARGHFNGAFKGLVRRAEVLRHHLWIRPTRDSIHAERIWLAALGLVGRFRFVPDAVYVKRYYEGSTSSRWRPGIAHELSVRATFLAYCRARLEDHLYRRVRAYTTWWTLVRLGVVRPPFDLASAEPFLPGGPSPAILPRPLARLRDDWRALHGAVQGVDGRWDPLGR